MHPKRTGGTHPAHIGSIITGSFDRLGMNVKARLKEYEVKKAWASVVGKNIAKRSRPKKLINDTLYVTVSTSAWMTELMHLKPDIVSKLNRELGEAAVKDIVFKAGSFFNKPAAGPPGNVRELSEQERESIEKAAAGVKDKALRELIKRVMEKGKSIEE